MPEARRRASSDVFTTAAKNGSPESAAVTSLPSHRCDLTNSRTERRWTTRRHEADLLRDIGGDTSADSAACYTLRPESVRNRGKSASWRPAELAAVDATSAILKNCGMQAVCRTDARKVSFHACCRHSCIAGFGWTRSGYDPHSRNTMNHYFVRVPSPQRKLPKET